MTLDDVLHLALEALENPRDHARLLVLGDAVQEVREVHDSAQVIDRIYERLLFRMPGHDDAARPSSTWARALAATLLFRDWPPVHFTECWPVVRCADIDYVPEHWDGGRYIGPALAGSGWSVGRVASSDYMSVSYMPGLSVPAHPCAVCGKETKEHHPLEEIRDGRIVVVQRRICSSRECRTIVEQDISVA